MKINKLIRKRYEKVTHENRAKTWHSKAYHQHFKGWVEESIIDDDGKKRIKRIYIGGYYRQQLGKRNRILLRFAYVGMFLMEVVLFITASTMEIESNSKWFSALSQFGVMAFLIWTLIALFNYLTVKQEMTISEYQNGPDSLRKASLLGTISFGVASLMPFLHSGVTRWNAISNTLQCSGIFLLAGMISFSINKLENRIEYLEYTKDNKLDFSDEQDEE